MFSANPVIRRTSENAVSGAITFDGIIHRTGALIILTTLGFIFSWKGIGNGIPGLSESSAIGIAFGGCIVGLILGLIVSFTQTCNAFLIGTYALCQGLFLGAISCLVEARAPGIAFQTATTTFGLFLLTLVLYRARILRATPLFTKIIIGALIGISVLYFFDIISGFFGHRLELIHGNSTGSILLSFGIVIIAAISFVLDFAAAERAVEDGVASSYAWRVAFGLLVGLVWLYMEILRLLLKLRGRND